MKILLINPPHIRDKHSSPENEFKINGFVLHPYMSRIRGVKFLFKLLQKFGLGKNVRYGVRAGSRWPFTMNEPITNYSPFPFFMAYAASYLQENGFEVNILDAVATECYDYESFLKKIRKEKADIVILECSSPTIDIDVWFANKIAEFTDVALAGPHLNSRTIPEIQANSPKIKYYLIGEYILSSLKMAQTQTPGVYSSEVVKDLDNMPFPFRDYEGYDRYYDPTMPTARPQLQVYGSKGCPFKCTFCAWPQNMYFGGVALRSPEKIAQEIKEAVHKFGYKSIFFDDDTFNMGTKRISELCDLLKEIGLPWTMMGRLDISPDWLYDKMVESGCVGMRFGIETFDLEVLKNIEKGIERKDFKATLEHITEKHPHLMIHLTMMKDMPGQTEEIHENDMKILKDMGYSHNNMMRSYQLSNCVPFPGTKLYEQMTQKIGEQKMKEFVKYDGAQDTVMKGNNV